MYLCAIMEDTRTRILQENYKAVHRFGFQGTRTDKVVAELGITKGAFYHYFPTKNDLGYAIVDEIILPNYTSIWKAFEHATEHFEVVLTETLQKYFHFMDHENVKYGCTLNNLMQEMSPIDEGFGTRIRRITSTMQQSIETGLKNGQMAGVFRRDMNPTQTAFFILAAIQGAFSIGKAMQSQVAFEMSVQQLIEYTQTLKN
jgi:AcrR family transcriptional regulator